MKTKDAVSGSLGLAGAGLLIVAACVAIVSATIGLFDPVLSGMIDNYALLGAVLGVVLLVISFLTVEVKEGEAPAARRAEVAEAAAAPKSDWSWLSDLFGGSDSDDDRRQKERDYHHHHRGR